VENGTSVTKNHGNVKVRANMVVCITNEATTVHIVSP
jgi:hypothetical protein